MKKSQKRRKTWIFCVYPACFATMSCFCADASCLSSNQFFLTSYAQSLTSGSDCASFSIYCLPSSLFPFPLWACLAFALPQGLSQWLSFHQSCLLSVLQEFLSMTLARLLAASRWSPVAEAFFSSALPFSSACALTSLAFASCPSLQYAQVSFTPTALDRKQPLTQNCHWFSLLT